MNKFQQFQEAMEEEKPKIHKYRNIQDYELIYMKKTFAFTRCPCGNDGYGRNLLLCIENMNCKTGKYVKKNVEHYNNTIIALFRSIETIYLPEERHKCMVSEVATVLGIPAYNCLHRVRDAVLCRDCARNIQNHILSGHSFQNIQLMHKCVVPNCTSARHNKERLVECPDCFVKYNSPINEAVPFESFRTFLLVLARYKIKMSPDIKKHIFYEMFGKPKAYYIYNGLIHNVFNVRNIKQGLILGDLKPDVCPRLVKDCTYRGSVFFLRVKYQWYHLIKSDESPIINVTFHNITERDFLETSRGCDVIKKAGFKVKYDWDDQKIECNATITWDDTTTMRDNNLLKIDPRFPLLVYK